MDYYYVYCTVVTVETRRHDIMLSAFGQLSTGIKKFTTQQKMGTETQVVLPTFFKTNLSCYSSEEYGHQCGNVCKLWDSYAL